MMYVTHRGLNATVQSMQATGQITEETAEQVLNIADPMRNGISWKKVSGWIQDEVAGSEKIIASIETDAAVSTGNAKVEIFL